MAKKIFVSDEDILAFAEESQRRLREFQESLAKRKFQGGTADRKFSIDFKIDDVKDDRKAILAFSSRAWTKMYALVDEFTGEVQWHGIVERKSPTLFFVKDILIFPHEATSATVVSNQEAYEKWLNDLDDETFNACRFHGHSHVNMAVSPSGVDMTYRKNVLDNFGTPMPDSDYFYIFIITNKHRAISGEIYDLQNNALYSADEITYKVVIGNGEYLDTFVAQAKECVKDVKYQYQSSSPTYYGSGFGRTPAAPYAPPPPSTKKNSPNGSAVQTQIKETQTIASEPAKGSADDPYDDFDDGAPYGAYDPDDWHRRIYGGH